MNKHGTQFAPYFDTYQTLVLGSMKALIIPTEHLMRLLKDNGHSRMSANEWIESHTIAYSVSTRMI